MDAILPAVRIPGDILSAFGDAPDWLVHVICVQETDDRHTVTMFDGSTNGFHGSPAVGRQPPADECDQGEQADDRQCGLPCQQGDDDQDE